MVSSFGLLYRFAMYFRENYEKPGISQVLQGSVDIHLKRKRDRAEGLHLDESSVLYIIDVYF